MAKAKAKSKSELLTLEKLIEYLNGKGVRTLKVNELTIKLPLVWVTVMELPETENGIRILNAYHTPIKVKKAKA